MVTVSWPWTLDVVDNGITSLGEWCDGQDPNPKPSTKIVVRMLLLFSWLIHVPMTIRVCNSRLPEEHFVCYQTSQRNWVIIKEYYRCLRKYMLSWRISRLGFVTPCIGEVYLWVLSVMHITISLASIVTNELVAGWCITERVKRLASNEI